MSIENDLNLIKSYEKEYCLDVFGPADVAFVKGKGCWLYDTANKKYLDMIGGIAVNSLGHAHPALTSALKEQVGKLIHCCNYYYIPQRAELAYKLCKSSFADKVFFSNSGAEANEAAIKLARGYFYYKGEPRYEIITAKMSFHGRTLATIAATGQEKFRKPFAPDMPGFKYVEFNDLYELEQAVSGKTAAVMLELIQGESGVHPASQEYIKGVRKLCNEMGILLIVDEVQTGVGRTGRMFCYENYGITPDIMTLAKGLGGGVPIGATLCTNKVATGMKIGDHGSTFGGNPLAMTAGNVVMDQFMDKDLLSNINKSSAYLFDELGKLMKDYPSIVQVRGMGLLIGIEFQTGISAKILKEKLLGEGILVSAIGSSTIRIAPPLIITKPDAKVFIDKLKKILKEQKKRPLQEVAAYASSAKKETEKKEDHIEKELEE
ncbi:MAG: aspartate aminotransferase family protein [Clostridiales bacterium]|nr:aspartate aminotransferase family protein [Clostridiales bacterium]